MKVIIGVSGGVDSSVAAMLLKEQGHQVEALFMKNWDEQSADGSCIWETDVEDAMQVCDQLDIPLNTIDLSKEYWQGVFNNFIHEYKLGRTPNPDVLCNQEIKFKAFLEHALELDADLIATGHYARIVKMDRHYLLRKGIDANKDQSYFLCRLSQAQLALSLFPLGGMIKPQIRKLAEKAGLITHGKKDSTGICFIGERPFRNFLSQYIHVDRGEICDIDGQVLGEHEGVYFYTLGQRQGLGIGGIKDACEQPWYVVNKDIENNRLVVAQGHDNPLLYSTAMLASNLHWISSRPREFPFACYAKTRYRQPDQTCVITSIKANTAKISFATPQRAVTPGQYVVFYDGDTCLGAGVIESAN